MRIIQPFILILLSVLLFGCSSGPGLYEKSYRQWSSPINEDNSFLLDEGADPRLILTREFDKDLKTFTDQDYIVVGQSKFNGPPQDPKDAVEVGKALGVTHVLLIAEYLYNGRKKAYKYYDRYDYIPIVRQRNGMLFRDYEAVRSHDAVEYYKNVPVFQQRAVYLVKRRID